MNPDRGAEARIMITAGRGRCKKSHLNLPFTSAASGLASGKLDMDRDPVAPDNRRSANEDVLPGRALIRHVERPVSACSKRAHTDVAGRDERLGYGYLKIMRN